MQYCVLLCALTTVGSNNKQNGGLQQTPGTSFCDSRTRNAQFVILLVCGVSRYIKISYYIIIVIIK